MNLRQILHVPRPFVHAKSEALAKMAPVDIRVLVCETQFVVFLRLN